MAFKIFGIIIMTIALPSSALFKPMSVPEDGPLNFTALAKKYGMASEEHQVTTEDGYILKLFHIPGDKSRPVLLIHGLMDSADGFVLRGPNSITSYLSKHGYDIWVGNYRGNKYSRRHIEMDPDTDPNFWDFGPHEHGIYDLSSTIDFVLNETQEDRLSAIGYSEGSTIMYVLTSVRPEYNEKIKIFISWAPICFLNGIVEEIPPIIELGNVAKSIVDSLHIEEIAGYDSVIVRIVRGICNLNELGIDICRQGLFYLAGSEPEGFESSFIPTIFWHFLAGTSKKNLLHMLQIVSSRRFAQYDYGTEGNLEKYNSTRPPDYDLSKVTMKVALFRVENDKLSTAKDVNLLKEQLPNVESYRTLKKLNHLGYNWSRNAHKEVHPSTLQILDKYNNK